MIQRQSRRKTRVFGGGRIYCLPMGTGPMLQGFPSFLQIISDEKLPVMIKIWANALQSQLGVLALD